MICKWSVNSSKKISIHILSMWLNNSFNDNLFIFSEIFLLKITNSTRKFQLNSLSSVFFSIDTWPIVVQWFHIFRIKPKHILRKPMKTWKSTEPGKFKSYNGSRNKNKRSPWWWSKTKSSSRAQNVRIFVEKIECHHDSSRRDIKINVFPVIVLK